MKKENIFVVIDDEQKRLRALQILSDAGEKIVTSTRLKQQVESLTVEQLQEYFKKKYRGRFYVDMKRLVAFALHEKGLSYCKIAKILHGKSSYSCVDKLLSGLDFKQIDSLVLSYFGLWIYRGKYPVSVYKKRPPQTEYEHMLNVDSIHFLDYNLADYGDF